MNANVNSYLPVAKLTGLIDSWRAEISTTKGKRAKLRPTEFDHFLSKTEKKGLPASLVMLTVLCCEWAFRVRLATKADIEKLLSEMETRLCSSTNPTLSAFQAHLLIKAIEPSVVREVKRLWIPVLFGFDTFDPHPYLTLFQSPSDPPQKRKRPSTIVTGRPGRPLFLAPKLSGLVVEALAKERSGEKGSGAIAKELYRLLLRREVQGWELKKWRTQLNTVEHNNQSLLTWMRERMTQAHHQTFEMVGQAVSPDVFADKCGTDPSSVLWWFNQPDILKYVYSVKWG